MPADRKTPMNLFICDHPDCFRAFVRKHDRKRHKDSHRPYEERRYACTVEGCTFRANQAGGLKSHMNTRWHKSDTEAEIGDAAASGPSHTPRGASPAPLLWVTYTPESTPYKTNQLRHQMAHDANHPVPAQTFRAVSPTPLSAATQRERTMPLPNDQPLDPGMVQGTSSEPCGYGDRMDSLTLPPLRGWERMDVEREAPSFSYSRTRHVPSSSSSEYPRPNPRMLF